MKFSAATLFAAAASAAVVERQGSTVFEVTEFSAGCIRHSTQCLYSFKVLQPGTMQTTPTECKATVSANTDGTLPDAAELPCTESSRNFAFTRSAEGLTFSVSQQVTPSSNQTGFHLIPADELVVTNEPNAIVENYTGATSFDLTFSL